MEKTDCEQISWALCTEVSLKDIKLATKKFDSSLIIGVASHGNVYGGVLIDHEGRPVAIKRWNKHSKKGFHQFENELAVLSKVNHPNLIWIGGCYEARGEMILLYEYMKNGTLKENLYGFNEGKDKSYLSWIKRLKICIEVARALHYLHKSVEEQHVHGDVNTKNILLDGKFTAKVSGFSYTKRGSKQDDDPTLEVLKANVAPGYLDPEAARSGKLTRKSDVYAFGVVLLEVLCARAAVDPSLPAEQVSLVKWVLHCQQKHELDEVVDPRLRGKIKPEGLSTYVDIAKDCLAEDGVQRPYLRAVEESLELVLSMQGPDEDEDHICGSNRGFQLAWNLLDEKQKGKKCFWRRICNFLYMNR